MPHTGQYECFFNRTLYRLAIYKMFIRTFVVWFHFLYSISTYSNWCFHLLYTACQWNTFSAHFKKFTMDPRHVKSQYQLLFCFRFSKICIFLIFESLAVKKGAQIKIMPNEQYTYTAFPYGYDHLVCDEKSDMQITCSILTHFNNFWKNISGFCMENRTKNAREKRMLLKLKVL